ncbi:MULTISPECIES: helix-turn-helix domain-containing protein [Limosilactobacillus]|uniref:helix-turn-helix domain-containing protein n=1 Tax=Limosilactobacillus TaxID=2742598 RepID=UPI001F98AD7A|nr:MULTISPECIES: helix-turn-helix transcriptional regulator [Limosilactobacillus]MDM8331559.1 helix-turn-helix transcriptional regulator [Limosilactobacillus pontis]HJA26901.1 helix-turn-helix domain-containing protein [Candidatus Limosilactobacillus intestinigallinarum]
MIGDKIRDLRNRKRLSQTELSKILHVSQQTITKWETGKAEPSSSAIANIAKYFGVSADYLLGTKQEGHISQDLDEAIDGAMSFDGQPVTEHDRKVMKSLWKAYLASKD